MEEFAGVRGYSYVWDDDKNMKEQKKSNSASRGNRNIDGFMGLQRLENTFNMTRALFKKKLVPIGVVGLVFRRALPSLLP